MGKSMGLMGMVSMVQACAKRYLASGQADRCSGGEWGRWRRLSRPGEATAHFSRTWVRAISPWKQTSTSVPGRYCLWW